MVTRRSLVACVVLLFVGVALVHADAAKDPKQAIIGKWQPKGETGVTIEFDTAGKVTVRMNGKDGDPPESISGTYKWVAKDSVEVTIVDGKDSKTERIKVAFDGDTMTTTDKKGKAEKFVRVP